MTVLLADLSLNGPCIFLVLCNRKKFFVELLPLNYEPADTTAGDAYDIMHGFHPGPRYPPVLPPLPGYDSSGSIEAAHLSRLYEMMYPTEALVLDQAGNQVINEIHNLIVTAGSPTIRELAGSETAQTSRQTLEDVLNPETILLQMVTVDGDAKLITRDDFVPSSYESRPCGVTGLRPDLPLIHRSQIEILEEIAFERSYKVLVGGQTKFCKVSVRDFRPISRDCEVLQQIQDAALDPSQVKVPHLEGLVSPGGKENAFGLLTNYIETQAHLDDFFPLKPGLCLPTDATREKWANQLERGIQLLHGAGVIWGNVNPSNIVIDQDGDLWLTNFSNGLNVLFTSAERACTVESDLEKIVKIY
ncbi:hypothetical protein BDZ45DRAFT_672607 [Acephala macrosclerotiorum]|nr:hypothetical protein BDZ45DRAFT_672607 [Acephala macrosclerotiorum]